MLERVRQLPVPATTLRLRLDILAWRTKLPFLPPEIRYQLMTTNPTKSLGTKSTGEFCAWRMFVDVSRLLMSSPEIWECQLLSTRGTLDSLVGMQYYIRELLAHEIRYRPNQFGSNH